ncbi:MAG: sugar phosphate isomerase/epimerase [Clostridia bacterium]|nr:sugar phosphate isomerase/epimerase [Clostridia bacterium]
MRKLGISIGGDMADDVMQKIDLVKNAGFTAAFTGGNTKDIMEQNTKLVQASGLEVDSLHAPFNGINAMWEDSEAGADIFARLMDDIDVCAAFNVPKTVVHISSGWNAPQMNDLGFSRYDKLVEHAAQKGVSIAFENLRKPGNLGALMERYEQAENVGFCWDAGHELCYTPRWEYLPLYGHRTICVHLHDNIAVRAGDLHMLPFDGKRDWAKAAAALKNSGYTGPVMLEAGHDLRFYNDLTDEEYYARAYAAAAKIRDLMDE